MEALSKEHYVQIYRKRTPALSQDTQFDGSGRPLNSESIRQSMMSLEERISEILSKKHGPYGPFGELEIAKGQLRKAKDEWKYHCDTSPNMSAENKKIPTDHYADRINKLSARKQVLEEESRALNKLLAEKTKVDEVELKRKQIEFRYMGICNLRDNLIWKCDQRDVVYSKGKPFFVDDGSSVDEYLQECIEHINAQKQAVREAEILKVQERDHAVALEQTEIEKNTKKILRRRKDKAA